MRFIGNYYHRNGWDWDGLSSRSQNLDAIEKTIRLAIQELEAMGVDVSDVGLIGTGLSGALVVPSLADRMGLPFAMSRQPTLSPTGNQHRDRYPIVGMLADRVFFVDDLIDSGKSIRRVWDDVKAHGATIVGAIIHTHHRGFSRRFGDPPSSLGSLEIDLSRSSGPLVPVWLAGEPERKKEVFDAPD